MGPIVSARQAAEFLGIKRATLYAYAARGRLESLPGPGRERRYRRADLARLKARREARASDEALALSAMRFGAPVIDTEITNLTPRGPHYRGHEAAALARSGTSFERVAELLWHDADQARPEDWSCRRPGFPLRHARAEPLAAVRFALAALDVRATPPAFSEDGERERGRELVRRAAAAAALASDPSRARSALELPDVAGVFLHALGHRVTRRSRAAINAALILTADHGLNASTFTARVAASTGADLLACINAAACALSGPRHGGACARVEALLDEAERLEHPRDVVAARSARGETLPGFGHPLYPAGDARGVALLALASEQRGNQDTSLRVAAAMKDANAPGPTLDFGLVALCQRIGLPRGSAGALFAVGRCAGWIAHVMEQRRQGFLVRPTARYVGRPCES